MSRIDTGLCFDPGRSTNHFWAFVWCQQPTFRRTICPFFLGYAKVLQKDWYKKPGDLPKFIAVFSNLLSLFLKKQRNSPFFRQHFRTDPQLSNHKLVDEAGTVFSLLVLGQFPRRKNIQDPTSLLEIGAHHVPSLKNSINGTWKRGKQVALKKRKMMMPTLPTCEVHIANLSGFHSAAVS